MGDPVLVGTFDAITYAAAGIGASRAERRRIGERIYYAARRGLLTKHGGPKRGKGVWNLREIQKLKEEGFFLA
jgi:hypothetical protein